MSSGRAGGIFAELSAIVTLLPERIGILGGRSSPACRGDASARGGETIGLFPDLVARLAPETALALETRGVAPLMIVSEALARAQRLIAAYASRSLPFWAGHQSRVG